MTDEMKQDSRPYEERKLTERNGTPQVYVEHDDVMS
jgi:hypothetical protein